MSHNSHFAIITDESALKMCEICYEGKYILLLLLLLHYFDLRNTD